MSEVTVPSARLPRLSSPTAGRGPLLSVVCRSVGSDALGLLHLLCGMGVFTPAACVLENVSEERFSRGHQCQGVAGDSCPCSWPRQLCCDAAREGPS